LYVEDTFDVVVTGVNDQPVVVSAIPDTTVVEDSGDIANYRDLNNVFSDVEDGSALTFVVQSNDNQTLVMPDIDPADSTLDLSFGPNQTGTAVIVIRATDTEALFAEDTLVVTVSPVASGIEDSKIPRRFALYQNAPNPFNPVTKIRFDIAHAGPVELRVYDAAGRLVRTLIDERLPQAQHDVEWDGRDDRGGFVASGVYFYRLVAPGFRSTRKMVFLK
jgi:hypothetical protein